MHILIADDDGFIRQVFSTELTKVGYTVSTAEDGDHALAMMRSSPPDLVLLDALMPGKDGFAVLKVRQNDPTLQRIPVIMLTSLDKAEDVEQAKVLGATDFFPKTTMDIDSLIAHVRSALPHSTDDV